MGYQELSGLRLKLDTMTEKIIVRFKERSGYKLNKNVYATGQDSLIHGPDNDGKSFFEFSLENIEKYHAKLGRYLYPDQHMLMTDRKNLPHSIAHRVVGIPAIPKVKINVRDDLVPFYLNFIKDICEDDDDPSTYGETVYCDADLVQLLNERINLGRYVANAKLKKEPSIQLIWNDANALREKLTHLKREGEVVLGFTALASKFDFNTNAAEKLARWVIDETIGVEIKYLQAIIAKRGERGYNEYRDD